MGIRTLGDLAALDPATTMQVLGSHGPELVRRARGIDQRDVAQNDPAKQVSNERTFASDIRDAGELDAVILGLCAKVGQRVRRKGMSGRTVTVKVRFSDFTTRTAQRTLATPTSDELEFGPVARELVHSLWTPGVGVRLLGVGVSGFDEQAEQLSLDQMASDVDTYATERSDLVRGIDAVREKFGDSAVRFGRDLANSDRLRKATETDDQGDDRAK